MISVYNSKDHRWRDGYNPLRGLSMPRLVGMLEAGERGQFADLQWFYYFMERSDAVIASVIQRRRAALLSVDWDIRLVAGRDEGGNLKAEVGREATTEGTEHTEGKDQLTTKGAKYAKAYNGADGVEPVPPRGVARVEPGTPWVRKFDPVLAEEQRQLLRYAYDQIVNFKDAMGFLWGGFFRGFSHLEKHLSADGLVERLEPVEPWFWMRDGMFGEWEYNRHANPGLLRGEAIDRGNFVVFETMALDRILSVLYLRKNLSQKDWDSFLAVYGIPSVFLVGPPNASADREREFQEIAELLINDGRGYLPNGSDIKFVNGGGGRPPFLEHIEYLDKQIVIAATGGLLTMLAEAGSGTLAGSAHTETFMQIARSDAVTLSAVLQRDIDKPLLEAFFPGQPALAYFEFSPVASDQTRQVVQDAVDLSKAGLKIDAAEVAEKTGYRVEVADHPSPKAATA